jgi:hypothetical protein
VLMEIYCSWPHVGLGTIFPELWVGYGMSCGRGDSFRNEQTLETKASEATRRVVPKLTACKLTPNPRVTSGKLNFASYGKKETANMKRITE